MSSERVVIIWRSIKDESDVHVLGFGLWSAIKLPFVDCCPIENSLPVDPCQAQGVFGGFFCPEGV